MSLGKLSLGLSAFCELQAPGMTQTHVDGDVRTGVTKLASLGMKVDRGMTEALDGPYAVTAARVSVRRVGLAEINLLGLAERTGSLTSKDLIGEIHNRR